ncbi:hypothetical protein Q5P01_019011 [Channa striata]|uniref:AIG1-type G domain-containing protein n=1 Tax=Channa striata TaxID=64152 RepID=A0AA88M0I6_CHASR|nr:hypothetical protein Q5P01_019011 [Channa striata]
MDPDPDLTIVLLGNTGVGKSASGNTILGRAAFESKTSFRPVTTRCSTETGEVFGKRISVIDTPGILETEEQMKTCCQNVLKSSRPCLFLVVLRVGRFTDEEEKKGVDTATRVLGDSGMKNSYLLFTGGDELDSSLPEYILNSKRSSLRDVVKSFEGRYHGFNNKDGGREQVRELLDKSEHLRTFELPGLQSDAVSIVLLGNSGSGKSAAGNKILGQTAFESRSSLKPVTTQIREETRQVFGKKITVIDTPGISGSEEQITTWCQRHLQSSIPCLFLVVVRIGRFTKEDQEAVEAAVRVVGPRRFKNCYLLFTGGDSLKDMSLTVFISEDEESSLSEVVSRFGDRIHQFNNQDSGQEEVRELLQKSAAELMESIKLTDRRIVLIGLCGGGKSSSGNTILGSDQFKTDCGFEPVRTGIVSKSAAVEGRWVTVVDFEGFCSRDTDPDHQLMIINQLSDPGPHVFVFVKSSFWCRPHRGRTCAGATRSWFFDFQTWIQNQIQTHICEQTGEVFGKLISVIDTPGILGSEEQIATCCQEALKSSRPSLFLVVVKVDRFTEEQKSAVDAAVRAVGDQGFNKTYLLFTGGDTLKNKPVEDFISQDNESSLPGVVRRFSTRFHLFNNEDRGLEQVRELLEKSGHLQSCEQDHSIDARESTRSEVTRIILIGPAGGGKSSAGNRIVGSCEFDIDCDFDGVRKQHTCASADVEGGQITVVDSAGFTAEDLTPDRLIQEIRALIQLADPGPHLFVLVVKIGRLSRGDSQLLQFLTQLFDGEVSKFTMVLFTHRDALVDQSLHHKIQSSRQVSELVSVCGGRYCVLDNTQREDTQQDQRRRHQFKRFELIHRDCTSWSRDVLKII